MQGRLHHSILVRPGRECQLSERPLDAADETTRIQDSCGVKLVFKALGQFQAGRHISPDAELSFHLRGASRMTRLPPGKRRAREGSSQET